MLPRNGALSAEVLMEPATVRRSLDDPVEAFAAAREVMPLCLVPFLPLPGHPRRASILHELVRIDLKQGWHEGRPRPLADHVRDLPDLLDDPPLLVETAYLEYRLRRNAGEGVTAAEYSGRYGVPTANWEDGGATRPRPADGEGSDGDVRWAGVRGRPAYPEVGDTLLDFRLVGDLGRGSFARVFVARQGDLAGRLVALKVSAEPRGEAATLAQLLHTNIVPIYSYHRVGPFHATCMPYLGSTTLASVLRGLRGDQGLPSSGRWLMTTIGHRAETVPQADDTPAEPEAPLPRAARGTTAILEMLGRMSYPDAVLWVVWRLADGLAHAHDRGIVHRDVKPANVLLTDEGQPMLLDFNLAHDARAADESEAGGTLAYMAPEQLQAYLERRPSSDPRSDVYSLGLVMYEMLTGQYPFARPRAGGPEAVAELLRDRQARPVPPADLAPGVRSILERCLEVDPARRYRSARELQEDLDRQKRDLPLLHAANPSAAERMRKWGRRHPRLSSSAGVGMLAAVVLTGLLAAFLTARARLARSDALAQLATFRDEFDAVRVTLATSSGDPAAVRRADEDLRRSLLRYGGLGRGWERSPALADLPSGARREVRGELGEAALMLARAGQHLADAGPKEPRLGHYQAALTQARRAGDLLGGEASRALRADLLDKLGQSAEAKQLRAGAGKPATARDCFLAGVDHAAAGRHREAVPLLKQALRKEPSRFAAWFVLGASSGELGHNPEALAAFNTCVALRPGDARSYFHRGLAQHRRGAYREAELDFGEALRLAPDLAKAWTNRAIARLRQGNLEGSLADLNEALDRTIAHTRLYFLRARVRRQLKDEKGAAEDVKVALLLPPRDADDFVARAEHWTPSDVGKALADLDEALELNPWSFEALNNKAILLAEVRKDVSAALAVLDEAVRHYPDSVKLLGGRAVYRARAGRVADAHADARACLERDGGPAALYQMACVYALTSPGRPDDRREALRLFATALRLNFNRWSLIARDADLAPVRDDPDFARVLRAARELAPAPPAGKP